MIRKVLTIVVGVVLALTTTTPASASGDYYPMNSREQFLTDWPAQAGKGYGVDWAVTDPDLISFAGGVMTMTAKRRADGTWRSPRYKTNKMYQYGTFSARIKVPTGKGSFPAFWLVDAYQPTAGYQTSAEIDVMECTDQCPVAWQTVHNWTGTHWQSSLSTPIDPTQWHIYTLRWTPTSIAMYVDGKMIRWVTPASLPSWPFNTPLYVILNVSVGNWYGPPDATSPAQFPMQVDYVNITNY